MRNSVPTSKDSLPLCLQARDVQAILGLSKSKVYDLFHNSNFPTVHIDKRMVVPREQFFDWLEQETKKIERKPIIYV